MRGVQFLLPRAPTVPEGLVRPLVSRACVNVRIAQGSIYDALQLMDAALVASGTATLETALCGVPMVVVYRASWPTYVAARAVVRVPRIALVNVVAERAVVPELIQHRATPRRIAATLIDLLRDEERCRTMKEGLREVKRRLGSPGAVERAAAVVQEMLAQKSEVR